MLKNKHFHDFLSLMRKITLVTLMISIPVVSGAQEKIVIGLHADPVISWFSSDNKEVRNDGARPGFNFGLTYNKYFTPNYSFSTGISLINAGGRLRSSETTILHFTNLTSTVMPGESVVYKIKYLAFPVGLKLQTNEIGYLTFFSDVGLDPKIVIGGKADIPSLGLSGVNAMKELNKINLSFHITGGIQYSLGGTTALVLGLNFENNFFDITKDYSNQPLDRIFHKMLSFRIGINF
jgi:Outer membrane protein beta-barrel domain